MTKRTSRSLAFILCFFAVAAFSSEGSSLPPDDDARIFELGDFPLESGVVLPNARLSYVTYGSLDESRTNAILLPSFFTGDHHGHDFLIGPNKALDPAEYFIVASSMIDRFRFLNSTEADRRKPNLKLSG